MTKGGISLAKKKGKIEDIRETGNALVKQLNEPGTWDDIKNERTELQSFIVSVNGKYWEVKYRDIGWGERNQITEALARKLGNSPNPMIYQREMQVAVIKRRVVSIADHEMQDKQGEPKEADWHSFPSALGEAVREGLFGDTGEVCNQIVQGSGFGSIEQLKTAIDTLVEKKNKGPDGIQTQDEVALKN